MIHANGTVVGYFMIEKFIFRNKIFFLYTKLTFYSLKGEPPADAILLRFEEANAGEKTAFRCCVKDYRPQGNLSLILADTVVGYKSQNDSFDDQTHLLTSTAIFYSTVNKTLEGKTVRCCIQDTWFISRCSPDQTIRIKCKSYFKTLVFVKKVHIRYLKITYSQL